ncbi:kinesin domain-containing protein [Chiua virens]|nr:kinesin domain-containing protein [Chiua virens]
MSSTHAALRIRPTTSADLVSIPARFQRTVIHATNSTTVSVDAVSATPTASGAATASSSPSTPGKKQVFTFDQVHSPNTTQHALFTGTAQPLLERFLEGFNCTILAYGQTSSGKTFTMTGIDLDANPSDPNNGMGIIPRAVSTIFSQAKKLKDERGGSWNFSIKGSFIEVYNEDLIDLLSSDEAMGARREVQIREGKDGSIIWGGLREVNVRNTNEVMNLIRQGTSIRRTNETDMNAQSSRSHAIFSLTLTQKKFTGSGPPPRSSSPLPPNGRSPSRLARPGSLYTGSPTSARVSSPTMGRPATPSFHAAMGRGGGLRPASSLGLRPPDGRAADNDDDSGEWTTIVSKFHFVDLAGSERLKRTAAAGERIKEGISINSGLLALGNVISALGDPSRAKSHTNSHVPYRDSKLTRLLQDSLGGNAHTLMIACVSPTEWNVAETVNTLKYANRARNIKNRAIVNEKEDWDDMEWLQSTVARLRKELKQIKESGGIVGPGSGESARSVSQPTEGPNKRLIAQMTELQNNYEDLREKYVDRTEELTRLRRELGERHRSSTGGTVGGTGKYEEIVGPVIEEYEKTISAMEAELGLNRAALRLTNELVEEKEDELVQITEQHSATELYMEELRSRLGKLAEREASTEAYVRDLEEKVKSYDETSMSSSESLTDLRRELARYKEAESHSASYISELETRLAKSDESVLSLQQTITRLESDSERRSEEVAALQARLENLERDGASWRTDLEERERKVKDLEFKMEEWERKKKEANEERARLSGMVGEVEQARRNLQDSNKTDMSSSSGTSTPATADLSLENQLIALQQTHAATLGDLSSVTAKYRDALQEIADLAAQIQEAKLANPTIPESSVLESVETTSVRRKTTGLRSKEIMTESQLDISPRKSFFRQAVSLESFHGRSASHSLAPSLSLSQELSSARSRKTSNSSHGTAGSISYSPTPPNFAFSVANYNGNVTPTEQRSASSMEKEIMRLQEVLKEREAEITVLEATLKEKEQADAASLSAEISKEPEDHTMHLSATTIQKFNAVRRNMQLHGVSSAANDFNADADVDESLDRLNELMLSMAQKESQHSELVDSLNDQLAQIRRAHDELVTLSRDQTLNMSNELEGLRAKHDHTFTELELVRQREQEMIESIKKAESDHATAIDALRSSHEEALRAKGVEVDELVACLKGEHETAVGQLQNQLSTATAALDQALKDHEEAFGKLKAEHEEELQRVSKGGKAVLERLAEEHREALSIAASEHAETMKRKEENTAADLSRTEEEYYNALTKLRNDHAEALRKQAEEAASTLERLREDHASEMRMAEKARDCSLSESQSARDQALCELQEEHTAAIARRDAMYAEDMEKLKSEHAQILTNKEEDYRARREHTKREHTTALAVTREQSEAQIEELTKSITQLEREATAAADKAREEHESSIQELQERQAAVLQEVTRGHEGEVAGLKKAHLEAIRVSNLQHDEERLAVIRAHDDTVKNLQAEHEAALGNLMSALQSVRDEHAIILAETKTASENALVEERNRSAAALAELEQHHADAHNKILFKYQTLEGELEIFRIDFKTSQERHSQALDKERQHSASSLTELEKMRVTERDAMLNDLDKLREQLESHQAALGELAATQGLQSRTIEEKSQIIVTMEGELVATRSDNNRLRGELEKVQTEFDKATVEQTRLKQEVSHRDSLADELERHRSLIAEMQDNLQRVKDEKDTLQAEKNKQEGAVRDLQAQLARNSGVPETPQRVPSDRNMAFSRVNGLNGKLPPPTPPPSVPPPPAPKTQESHSSVSTQSSAISPSTSKDSQIDSPATSIASVSISGGSPLDTKAAAGKIEDQARAINEQEVMIKTLNKQLSHCESDLATHMDLVSTLETSLSDSEKNLRKARMQATELARERDSLNAQLETLRNELQEARREVVTVRRSIVEEKQSLESRLDEERRAKERARAQLDSRMDELQKRKSKFACI